MSTAIGHLPSIGIWIVRPQSGLVNCRLSGKVRYAEAEHSSTANDRDLSLSDQSPEVILGVTRTTSGLAEIHQLIVLCHKQSVNVGQKLTTYYGSVHKSL
jgi:hypothetical protein